MPKNKHHSNRFTVRALTAVHQHRKSSSSALLRTVYPEAAETCFGDVHVQYVTHTLPDCFWIVDEFPTEVGLSAFRKERYECMHHQNNECAQAGPIDSFGPFEQQFIRFGISARAVPT